MAILRDETFLPTTKAGQKLVVAERLVERSPWVTGHEVLLRVDDQRVELTVTEARELAAALLKAASGGR